MSRAGAKPGPRNHQWKGGRTIASNGYVLIKVGVGHHLADVRGYAYEHRVVLEKKLGRRLRLGEIAHHVDGVKTNNRPSNLEPLESISKHMRHHHPTLRDRRYAGQPNPVIACACGCGATFPKYDKSRRSRKFVSGHNV